MVSSLASLKVPDFFKWETLLAGGPAAGLDHSPPHPRGGVHSAPPKKAQGGRVYRAEINKL